MHLSVSASMYLRLKLTTSMVLFFGIATLGTNEFVAEEEQEVDSTAPDISSVLSVAQSCEAISLSGIGL